MSVNYLFIYQFLYLLDNIKIYNNYKFIKTYNIYLKILYQIQEYFKSNYVTFIIILIFLDQLFQISK